MPSFKIETLIEKQDTNEIVRDQIAAILRIELDHQKDMALDQGKNPIDYDIDVYVERIRPWELLSDENGEEISETPLVNVTFDSDTFDNKGSDQVGNQKSLGVFYIDCYGHRNSYIDENGEKQFGDELTSRESDRIARLIRNILMAGAYSYLGLQSYVFKRYVLRREKFVPSDREGKFFENVIATRLTFEVSYKEFSPQSAGVDLELIINGVEIDETGLVNSQEFNQVE